MGFCLTEIVAKFTSKHTHICNLKRHFEVKINILKETTRHSDTQVTNNQKYYLRDTTRDTAIKHPTKRHYESEEPKLLPEIHGKADLSTVRNTNNQTQEPSKSHQSTSTKQSFGESTRRTLGQ